LEPSLTALRRIGPPTALVNLALKTKVVIRRNLIAFRVDSVYNPWDGTWRVSLSNYGERWEKMMWWETIITNIHWGALRNDMQMQAPK
jgi:hypothetical protein